MALELGNVPELKEGIQMFDIERVRRWRTLLAALAIMSLVAAGCGDDDESSASTEEASEGAEEGTAEDTEEEEAPAEAASIPVVDVVATGEMAEDGSMTHRFEPPTDLTAGPTQLNLVNDGMEPHHLKLIKLNDGVTRGTYLMICFIPGPTGAPHAATGMVDIIQVGPADGETAEMPEPDVTVNMVDFGFDANELPASGVVEVVNTSEAQAHEMVLFALAEGKTGADVAEFFSSGAQGPPPFSAKGGIQGLMPGMSRLLVLEDMPAGDYVMIVRYPTRPTGFPTARRACRRRRPCRRARAGTLSPTSSDRPVHLRRRSAELGGGGDVVVGQPRLSHGGDGHAS